MHPYVSGNIPKMLTIMFMKGVHPRLLVSALLPYTTYDLEPYKMCVYDLYSVLRSTPDIEHLLVGMDANTYLPNAGCVLDNMQHTRTCCMFNDISLYIFT